MIYFDNAATTFPKPAETVSAVDAAMRYYGANPGRSGHRLSAACAEKVYECRERAARLFGCKRPENAAFTGSCTQAVNTVIYGVMSGGGHMVISDMEHNAVLRPAHHLAGSGAAQYSVAETFEGDPEATVRSFARALRPDTRMIAVAHASNVTGAVAPVRELAALAHANGLLMMVDAAQSAGTLPIDMERDGTDFLCLPGHKGLYGPMGVGMLLSAHDSLPEPLLRGGTGSASLSYDQPEQPPDRLESGTLNLPGIMGLSAGMGFVERMGTERLRRRESGLAEYIARELARLGGVELYGAERLQRERLPVLAFNVGDLTGEQTAALLDREGIAVRGGFQCAALAHKKLGTLKRGVCRVSIGAFNGEKQAERLISAVRKIILRHN